MKPMFTTEILVQRTAGNECFECKIVALPATISSMSAVSCALIFMKAQFF